MYHTNNNKCLFSILIVCLFNFININCVQLSFELPDNAVQCFYEEIKKGTAHTVEFQVITGGNYDVDMIMKAPNGKVLYQDQRKQYDSFRSTAEMDGEYEICFSNEFSTYTHKLVFVDWQIGDTDPLGLNRGPQTPLTAMTLMESSLQTIHDQMNNIQDQQKHYQLREAQGRSHAEDLNERVNIWSIMQLGVILLVGILQVTLIRSFFANRR